MLRRALFIFLIFTSTFLEAGSFKLSLTPHIPSADMKIYISPNSLGVDNNIYLTNSFPDFFVCYTNKPIEGAIEVEYEYNTIEADYRFCFVENALYADKKIYLSSTGLGSDFRIGFTNTPTIYSTNIYIKGVDVRKLSNYEKIAIFLALKELEIKLNR